MGYEGGYRQRMSALAANWRVLALRRVAALLYGLVVFFWLPFTQPRRRDVLQTSH
jgi:predicted LPLAT superfamily acyltransferase